MARNRFVVPDTQRVPLSDGDFLILKKELSYGEALELNNAWDGNGLDQKAYNLTRAALWIVDWSFTDAEGKPVAWDDGQDDSRAALEILERRKTLLSSLDRATGIEIVAAINDVEAESDRGKASSTETSSMEAMQVETKTETQPPTPVPVREPVAGRSSR